MGPVGRYSSKASVDHEDTNRIMEGMKKEIIILAVFPRDPESTYLSSSLSPLNPLLLWKP
jgi:hypothetical protein